MYLYTGEITVTPEIAFDVMKLSQSYLLERLRILCELEVTSGIDEENASDLLMEAEKYHCNELKVTKNMPEGFKIKEFCLKFIITNHKKVVVTEGFKALPKELMLEIMTNLAQKV